MLRIPTVPCNSQLGGGLEGARWWPLLHLHLRRDIPGVRGEAWPVRLTRRGDGEARTARVESRGQTARYPGRARRGASGEGGGGQGHPRGAASSPFPAVVVAPFSRTFNSIPTKIYLSMLEQSTLAPEILQWSCSTLELVEQSCKTWSELSQRRSKYLTWLHYTLAIKLVATSRKNT
jgi:hypothetical protein